MTGTHVRLYDVQSSGVRSTVRGGYDSDEVLANHMETGNIYATEIQEISVRSEDAGRGSSMESFGQAC
jgi:hypothetical protein